MRFVLKFGVVTLLPASALLADFSYEQTSKLTGGAMASMMKVAGVFSKQMREPIKTTVVVKGDRMVTLAPQRASIIDLAKETITEVDFQKKTYSVMTFAEMKQMLESLSKETKKDPNAPEMSFKVSVQDTGASKQIAGFDTKETIIKMIMETTNQKGQKGGMVVTADMWLAPAVAGYEEVKNFHARMAQKLAWTPGSFMQMGGSEVAKGMAEVAKQSANLNGIPVFQVIKMGAEGQPQTAQAGGSEQPAPQQAQQPEQQQQPQQQRDVQIGRPSIGGALGGALGGRLGGFGRKKKEPEQQQQAPQQTAQPSGQQRPPDGAGSLMEMTTELSGFSAAPVDGSKFEVPGNFKQVQPDKRGR